MSRRECCGCALLSAALQGVPESPTGPASRRRGLCQGPQHCSLLPAASSLLHHCCLLLALSAALLHSLQLFCALFVHLHAACSTILAACSTIHTACSTIHTACHPLVSQEPKARIAQYNMGTNDPPEALAKVLNKVAMAWMQHSSPGATGAQQGCNGLDVLRRRWQDCYTRRLDIARQSTQTDRAGAVLRLVI